MRRAMSCVYCDPKSRTRTVSGGAGIRYRRFRSSLPGLKRMVFPGGIFTSTPVLGLRPIPFFRCLTWKTPKPRSSMRCPRASALRRPSMTVSTACAALTREISDISATLLTISALIMRPIISLAKPMDERHRIDLWLKHVCLFKHRSQATDALRGGLVKVNGQRVKPATIVQEGDVIEWFAGGNLRRMVVQAVPSGQQSKESARTMYLDQS